MLTIKLGNIFESNASTLVNTVNCVGVMGKGIALDYKKRYPDMHREYVELCKNGLVKPGKPYIYKDLLGASVINFPTKDHWKSPSKLSYIISGLEWFVEHYKELGITSIAFPPLGCGNGGLSWELVGPVMYKMLKDLPINIEIYAPYGTKSELLSKTFLENISVNSAKDIIGSKAMKFNDKWLLLPYIVQELNGNRHALKVGRTILQKICYILTRTGIETGFQFVKGTYGPYSKEVNDAIVVLSNTNFLHEKQMGKMISVMTDPGFKLDRKLFKTAELDGVERTIDLFSRIKNTDQAELISTVIYAADAMSKRKDNTTELDIYQYVMEWKPRWKDTKSFELSESIRNLMILGWISAQPSMDLPHSSELEF